MSDVDIDKKISRIIQGWEAGHDGQPPTWLQLHPKDQEKFGTAYDYRNRSIQIVYSLLIPEGVVRCGQGRVPESK